MTDSFTRARAVLSVNVNGVLLNPSAVIDSLHRFCRPLAFHNPGHDHDLSLSGSCLMVRHRERDLLVCSRHQLINAGREANEIVAIVDGEGDRAIGVTPRKVSQAYLEASSDPEMADAADLLVAEFTPVDGTRDLSRNFIRMDLATIPDLTSVDPATIDAVFCIGYPTGVVAYEPFFDHDWNLLGVDIRSRWVKLYLDRAPRTPWDSPGLVALVPSPGQAFLDEPDGISGAPVFFVHGIRARSPSLGFAGVVVRANKEGRLNIVEAAHVRSVVDLRLRAEE